MSKSKTTEDVFGKLHMELRKFSVLIYCNVPKSALGKGNKLIRCGKVFYKHPLNNKFLPNNKFLIEDYPEGFKYSLEFSGDVEKFCEDKMERQVILNNLTGKKKVGVYTLDDADLEIIKPFIKLKQA